jgi:hypothetical protein
MSKEQQRGTSINSLAENHRKANYIDQNSRSREGRAASSRRDRETISDHERAIIAT